jgi:endonuclease YncB( thermonuclease family)
MVTTVQLSAAGTIDVDSFWPAGHADADTTTLEVLVGDRPFELENPLGSGQIRRTGVYRQAYTRSPGENGEFQKKPLISEGRIKVRLQRIDAPELHITPGQVKGASLAGLGWFQKFRQRQAETAVAKLRTHLLRMAKNNRALPCSFVSRLDAAKGPSDAIDKYGRFVGDIWVGEGAKKQNLNLWLLQQGWAIVALYDSMQADEIDESLAAWAQGQGAGIRAFYREAFEPFEFLVFRAPGPNAPAAANPARDRQAFIHPKYFRRYVTWWAHHHAGGLPGSFADYLEAQSKRSDRVYRLSEFRAAGKRAPLYPLYDRASDGDAVGWSPDEFIFKEAPSTAYIDKGGRATPITAAHWFD